MHVGRAIDLYGMEGAHYDQAMNMVIGGRCYSARAGRIEDTLSYGPGRGKSATSSAMLGSGPGAPWRPSPITTRACGRRPARASALSQRKRPGVGAMARVRLDDLIEHFSAELRSVFMRVLKDEAPDVDAIASSRPSSVRQSRALEGERA